MQKYFLIFLLMSSSIAFAKDLGFRYVDGRCVNAKGLVGLNPSFFGNCGDFRNMVLNRLDLSDVDFAGSNFESANLQLSIFERANLTGVQFQSANLSGANLTNAVLKKNNFSRAILRGTIWGEITFSQTDFSEADLTGSLLSYFQAVDCNFSKAQLSSVQLDESRIERSTFDGANLKNANLQKSTLNEVSFEKSDLRGANFQNSKMTNIKLTGARFNNRSILPFSNQEALRQGMLLRSFNEIAKLNDFSFIKIRVNGPVTDSNILQACRQEDLEVPCNDRPNGPYSDNECRDVGFRDGESPMRTLSLSICNIEPRSCKILDRVFTYMGTKLDNGDSCGVVNGVWCTLGKSVTDMDALCVEKF